METCPRCRRISLYHDRRYGGATCNHPKCSYSLRIESSEDYDKKFVKTVLGESYRVKLMTCGYVATERIHSIRIVKGD